MQIIETKETLGEKTERLTQELKDKIDEIELPMVLVLGILDLVKHDVIHGTNPDVY